MNQLKRPYENAFVEIITFSANDIIQTSGETGAESSYPDSTLLPWDTAQ